MCLDFAYEYVTTNTHRRIDYFYITYILYYLCTYIMHLIEYNKYPFLQIARIFIINEF